jgi:hypothetical protein
MKIPAKPPFWSLGPIATASRLELACWIAALGLAFALALAPAPAAGSSAREMTASPTATVPPHLTIYQQHCIERIMTRVIGQSEEEVARRINTLCIEPFRASLAAARRRAAEACDRALPVRLTLAVKPAGGCPTIPTS